MQPIEALYRLQELDERVTGIERELAEVPPSLQAAALRKELEVDRAARDRLAEAVKRGEMGVRRSEGEAADAKAKLRELEEALYGGTVASPKELQNIEAKVDDFRRRAEEADEEAFSQLEQVERRQQELTEVERRIAERAAAARKLAAEGDAMRQEIELRLAMAEGERDDARSAVDGEWLAFYDRLYKELQGTPIARVSGGVCQGCRVSLPTSVVGKVRTNDQVVRCEQCGRLLCSTG